MIRSFWIYWTLTSVIIEITNGLTCETCYEPGKPKSPCVSTACGGGNDESICIRADCVHHSCYDPYFGTGDHSPTATSEKGHLWRACMDKTKAKDWFGWAEINRCRYLEKSGSFAQFPGDIIRFNGTLCVCNTDNCNEDPVMEKEQYRGRTLQELEPAKPKECKCPDYKCPVTTCASNTANTEGPVDCSCGNHAEQMPVPSLYGILWIVSFLELCY